MPYLVKDKIQFLAEASKILSSSLDYNITLAIIAKLIVNNLADFCMIDLLEDGSMQRVAVKASDPKKQKMANMFFDFPPDPRNKKAIYEAAKSKTPIIIKKITPLWLKTVSRIEKERNLVNSLKMKSFIFAPLLSRNQTIGVITIGSSSKIYDENDATFIEELAIRAGIAVDKAKLYKDAQDALQTRDEFLAIASHELRTPLTSLLLNLQLTLSRIHKLPSGQVKVETITSMIEDSEQQAYRLSRLITDLLNVSVVSTGKLILEKEDIRLLDLAKEIKKRFEIQLLRSKTNLVIKGANVKGNWDKVRIEQVLTNLITNAIKYGKNKPILIEVKKSDNKAVITIEDKGIGIGKEDQAHIFDRFKRGVSSREYKGLGVGLYIAKQIIEAHGGKIKVKSKIGKGTTFTVELPLD